MSAEEFARLKHDIESRQVEVDRAFARLDDFDHEHNGEADSDSSAKSFSGQAKERLALVEHLMEAMSKLNASYKTYVELLEKKVGF